MIKNYLASFKGLSNQVWLLALILLVNRSGTMVIPFLSIYMTQSLGLSLQQSGVVLMFFGIGAVIGNYLGGKLADRYGAFPILFSSMFLTGVMFLIMEHVTSYVGLCVAVLLTTVLADIFRPANMKALAEKSLPENRTRSISLIRLSFNLGWAIAPAVGGVAIAWYGYAWLFRLDGATCIAASILILLLLDRKTNVEDKALEQIQDKRNSKTIPMKFWLFLSANFLGMVSFMQIVSALPVFYRAEVGLSEQVIGGLMALNGIFIAVFEMPFVFKYEKRFSAMTMVMWGTVLFAISYFIFNFGSTLLLSIACILMLSIGEILQMPFANAWILSIAPEERIGQYMAYYGISFSLSFIVAPPLGMYLADHLGYLPMWNIMSAIGLIAALAFYMLNREMSFDREKKGGLV